MASRITQVLHEIRRVKGRGFVCCIAQGDSAELRWACQQVDLPTDYVWTVSEQTVTATIRATAQALAKG